MSEQLHRTFLLTFKGALFLCTTPGWTVAGNFGDPHS
jgi:hypothetical protein